MTKIELPGNTGQILFDYVADNSNITFNRNESRYLVPPVISVYQGRDGVDISNFGVDICPTPLPSYCIMTSQISGWCLSKITSSVNGETIDFVSTQDRTDLLNARKLNYISITKNSTNVKRIDFSYAYFNEFAENNPNILKNGRLKLINVQESAQGLTVPPHLFSYYDTEPLPEINSASADYWGFYNGIKNGITNNILKFVPGMVVNFGFDPYIVPGANREVDATVDNRYLLAGTLKKIVYPTGGETEFVFEPNSFGFNQYGDSLIFPVLVPHEIKLNATSDCQYTNESDCFDSYQFTTNIDHICSTGMLNNPGDGICALLTYKVGITKPQGMGAIPCCFSANVHLTSNSVNLYYDAFTNGNTIGSDYIYKTVPVILNKNQQNNFSVQVNFDVVPADALLYSFAKITYYTQEMINFQPLFTQTSKGPGIRIAKMVATESANSATKKIRTYSYNQSGAISNGHLFSPVQFFANTFLNGSIGVITENFGNARDMACPVLRLSSSSMAWGATPEIGYREVTASDVELVGGNAVSNRGYEKNQFSVGPADMGATGYPAPIPTSFEAQRGQVLSVRKYNSDHQLVASDTFEYEFPASFSAYNNPQSVFLTYGDIKILNISKIYSSTTQLSNSFYTSKYTYQKNKLSRLKNSKTTIYDFSGNANDKVSGVVYSPLHHQPNLATALTSSGKTLEVRTRYAKDFTIPTGTLDEATTALSLMQTSHIDAQPVIRETWEKNGTVETLQDAEVVLFKNFGTQAVPMIRPSKVYKTVMDNPLPVASYIAPAISGGNFVVPSATFTLVKEFPTYNAAGNLVEEKDPEGVYSAYVWDQAGIKPTAQALNARSTAIAFTSFERLNDPTPAGNGSWTITNSTPSLWSTTALKAGAYGFTLPAGVSVSRVIALAGKYRLSCWATYQPVLTGGTVVLLSASPANAAGLKLYQWEVTTTAANQTVTIAKNASATTAIDDLRLHPADAMMKTFTFDLLGRLSTSTSETNLTTYYEYDALSRLVRTRNDDGHITQQAEYHYKN